MAGLRHCDLPRYSQRRFPAYAFVPGQAPHPTRDPAGHSYGHSAEVLPEFDASAWADCETYLYGVDLFNHGFWWEAHEAWEAVWVAAGRQSATGQFVQGLIQISVAQLKRHQGFEDVARRMAIEGMQRMGRIEGRFLGIDVAAFKRALGESFVRPGGAPVDLVLGEPA